MTDLTIEAALKHYDDRIQTTTDVKLHSDLVKSLESFKARIERYQGLLADESRTDDLPQELLDTEMKGVTYLRTLDNSQLKKLYAEFPQRMANYPDAVNAMKKRWSQMQPPISVITRMEMPGKLRRLNSLSHFSALDPDLFSGAIKLLYTMINSDSYNMMASLGESK